MKKRFLTLILSLTAMLMCIFGLTACGENEPPAPKYYTITWQNYDGSILETDANVKEGLMPTYDSAMPTKESDAEFTFEFSEWSPEIKVVDGDITYIAQFSSVKNKYTVTWKNYDGSILETDENVQYGKTPVYSGETPVKEKDAQYTYEFSGWSPEIKVVDGDITYIAQFSSVKNKYTVTWKDYDGTVLETDDNVEYGTTPSYDKENPTREKDAQHKYTFSGWNPTVDSVTGNVIYTAQYSITLNEYTVTWKNYDGTILETDTEVLYGTIPTYNGNTPTKDKDAQYTYAFNGWDKTISAIVGDITYTARYTDLLNKYTVTWKDYDGTVLELDESVEYGAIPTYNGATPTRERAEYTYTFIGWDEILTEVIGNVVYIAQYSQEVSKFTVVWKNYDGTVLKTDTDLLYQAMPEYAGQTPTREKDAQYTYSFSGWSPSISKIVDDVVYTAQYSTTINKYTVTWKNYDGTVLETDAEVPYGEMPIYNGNTPTKNKDAQYTYAFIGWDKTVGSVVGDITYTARYSKTINKYTITWKNYDGTILKTDSVAYGSKPNYTGTTPTKQGDVQYGYIFDGWSPSVVNVTGEAEYIAMFSQTTQKYTVTWKNYDGTVLETDTNVAYGSMPTYNGNTPTKPYDSLSKYIFEGWTPIVDLVNGDTVYTAVFSISESTTFTIKYDANGGMGAPSFQTKNKGQNITLSSIIPTNREHVFIGWICAYDGNTYSKGASFSLDANVTLYAVWGHGCENCGADGRISLSSSCYDCGGDGRVSSSKWVTCSRCSGYGSITITCLGCDGTGKLLSVCPGCSGYGCLACRMTGFLRYKTCTVCSGSGIEGGGSSTCSSCSGRGGWNSSTTVSCSSCGGDGTTTSSSTCNTCNGQGNIKNSAQSCTLTLKNGTTTFGSKTVYYGEPFKLNIPTKSGYTFVGWFDVQENGTQYTDRDGVSLKVWDENNNKNLYAQWIKNYNITYNLDNGSANNPTVYNIETPTFTLNNPTKAGYKFIGWSGTDIDGISMEVIIPSISTGDREYTANWEIITYTITYNLNGGVNNEDNVATYTVETQTITLQNPTRAGYTFNGWYLEEDFENQVTKIELGSFGDVELYAKWTMIVYTITYNHGYEIETEITPTNTCTITNNSTYKWTLSNGVWTSGNKGVNSSTSVYKITANRNVTVSFEYKVSSESGYDKLIIAVNGTNKETVSGITDYISYTVTLKAGDYLTFTYSKDGSQHKNDDKAYIKNLTYTVEPVFESVEKVTIDTYTIETPAFNLITPTRAGYTFNGWYLEEDFENQVTKIELGACADIELYGKWTINIYDIEYELNGGVNSEDNVATYTVETQTITLQNPTRACYTFNGWYLEEDFETKVTKIELGSFGDIELYAKWTINVYDIEYELNGGVNSEDNVATYTVETQTITLQNPTRAGYTFNGWYLEEDFENQVTKIELGYFGAVKVYAKWTANTDTKYTVIYYLQNIEDDNYPPYETVELMGETDTTTANATIKEYQHFTYNASKSILSGNINGDGSLVLKVYYTRDTYKLSVENSSMGSITNAGTYKYGKQITAMATPYSGYNFVGWYKGEELLSSALTYTFTATQNITAKFEVASEMANFNFTATTYSCQITGIVDNTVTEVVVPDYVTSISKGAFAGCSSLESITLPFVGATKDGATNTHFGYIFGASGYLYNDDSVPTSLKIVTITGGESVGKGAFCNCSSLISIVIPNSVTSIGDYAFEYCSSLTSVTIGNSVAWIGSQAFTGCVKLVEVINKSEHITITKGGRGNGYVGFYALEVYNSGDVFNETKISYDNDYIIYTDGSDKLLVGYIGKEIDLILPNYITKINRSAFYSCDSLISVVIPDSVTSIGDSAFSSCVKLVEVINKSEHITITKGSSSNGYAGYHALAIYNSGDVFNETKISYDNDYVIYTDGSDKILVGYIGKEIDLILPNYITKINGYAFSGCDSLISVVIPDSVTSIGDSAFSSCDSLTSVVIGDSVTSIGSSAFYDCTSLTSVEIPNSVTSIGKSAFYNCSSLTSVVIGNSVTSIGDYTFYYCYELSSIIYRGTESQWKDINKGSSWWSNYTGNYNITYSYKDI